jgi:hypothetical protein
MNSIQLRIDHDIFHIVHFFVDDSSEVVKEETTTTTKLGEKKKSSQSNVCELKHKILEGQ